MRRNLPLTGGLCLALALTLTAVPLAAQKGPASKASQQMVRSGPITLTAVAETPAPGAAAMAPREVRAQLAPLFERLKTDAQFQALGRQLAGNMDNQEVVDRFLRYLPIPPVEYLELDMHARRYEFGIPRFVHEWNVRWIQLHEENARALYGDTYVDSQLSGWAAEAAGEGDDPAGIAHRLTVGTNRNAAATSSPAPEAYQGEIQVAVNPNNPNQIVAAANTWDTIGGSCAGGIQAVFYSSDGGATWGYTCPPDHTPYGLGSCSGTVFGSDPAVYWNDSGEVFLNHMMLCSSFFGTDYAMVVARSANGGATWSAQGVIKNSWPTGELEDKNFYVIDNNTASPFYGRHYTCWDRNNNEKFAYSTSNGASWTETDLPTPPGGGFDLGCDIAVEDNGTVHVVFNTLTCGASCTNERMHYTRSTNGGASWSAAVLVRDFNLTGFSNTNCPDAQDNRCIGPFGAIDVDNSGGACDGTLYASFTDYTSGGVNNSDVWISRSTNGGTTWSAPILVNDDGVTNRIQFHPFLVVDQSQGTPVMAWHDARNDAGNDAIDYFVSRSLDCGLTWETNTQASQASSEFNNSGISYSNENTADNPNYNPNQYGEYMGLDARGCKAYLAWADTRHFFPSFTTESQDENVGFAVVEFDCGPPPVCGNNTAETGEVCDGTDLQGETCSSQGFSGGGTLACATDCLSFDTSACIPGGPVCGNGIIEAGEQCDGANLGGETCTSQGFSGGTLSCNASCQFDTSACTTGGCTTQTLYSNNFDSASGLSDWTRGTFDGSNTNNWRGVQNCSAASSPNIFRFGGTSCTRNYSRNRFIFAQPNGATGIAVPAGSSDARLTFNHRRQFETGYDGGLLALSFNSTNYTVVPAAAILSGASYDGNVLAACAPAGSAGLPIFTGTQSSFVGTEIDLDAACDLVSGGSGGCGGQSLYIAFTGVTDCSTHRDGWFLDDVTVTACVP